MLENFKGIKTLPKDYFRIEKIPLKICGISFTGNESKAYICYTIIIILIFNVLFVSLQLMATYKQAHTPEGIDQNGLVYQFATILGTAKMVTLLRNRKRVGKLMQRLQEEPFVVNPNDKDKTKEEWMKKSFYFTRVQAAVYWVSLFIAIVPIQINSLVRRLISSDSNDWTLPFGSIYPVNVTYSPNFEICWIHEMISIHFNAWNAAAPDVIIASVFCHTIFHLKVLQIKFKNLVKDSFKKMLEDNRSVIIAADHNADEEKEIDPATIPWKYLKQFLVEAVDYHLAIISICDEMEEVFNGMLLLVLLATLGMMGIMVYRASMLDFNNPMIIRYAWDTPVAAIQVFVVSFWGETLMAETEEVGNAAYETNFVGTDLRFQQSVLVVIRRSQEPKKITFWKFTHACIATFTWLLQSTYSAFMLLRNTAMKNQEDE